MFWWLAFGIVYLIGLIWMIIEVRRAPLLDESDPENPRFVYPRKGTKK